MVKYATKGIDKKTRQEITKNWPIPDSKSLKGLEVDRFFRKNYFQGKRWNAKLDSSKINNQLRILDSLGPLAVLWAEANRIKKLGEGMDPSDVIQLVQRAVVLTGNAHFIFNSERRKSIMAKTMPDNTDLLSDKKGKKALAKSKRDLFGRKFLKFLAKESKDNRLLKDLLIPSSNRKSGKSGFKGTFKKPINRTENQFFQNRPANNLHFAGQRQQDHTVHRGRNMPPQGQGRQNKGPVQYQNQGKPPAA